LAALKKGPAFGDLRLLFDLALGCILEIIVSQKLLTQAQFLYYDNYMANVLSFDKQITIVGSLCEGSSIRAIERLTGVHRDTIMRLGVRIGQGCTALCHPINSARDAVRAAIVQEFRSLEPTTES
jgi:hypothetical protein